MTGSCRALLGAPQRALPVSPPGQDGPVADRTRQCRPDGRQLRTLHSLTERESGSWQPPVGHRGEWGQRGERSCCARGLICWCHCVRTLLVARCACSCAPASITRPVTNGPSTTNSRRGDPSTDAVWEMVGGEMVGVWLATQAEAVFVSAVLDRGPVGDRLAPAEAGKRSDHHGPG